MIEASRGGAGLVLVYCSAVAECRELEDILSRLAGGIRPGHTAALQYATRRRVLNLLHSLVAREHLAAMRMKANRGSVAMQKWTER